MSIINDESLKKAASESARDYLWHEYTNAESEFEEVELLADLLRRFYLRGFMAGVEAAAKKAESHKKIQGLARISVANAIREVVKDQCKPEGRDTP